MTDHPDGSTPDLLSAGGHYDVVVVGAGPGGTYAAWRLQTGSGGASGGTGLPADPADRRILLVEGSLRVGGRLESLTPPGCPDLRAEFGGMGFSPHDTLITAIVDDVLRIPAAPFIMPTANDLVYIRGTHLTHAQLSDPTLVPYRLAPDEVGKTPGELIGQAVDKVIPGGSSFTTAQWRAAAQTVRVGGRLLGELGYWNVLLQGMSNEAFNFCTDAMGHFFEFDNWNAAQALPWLLSQSVGPYRTLIAGYDELPKQMYHQFVANGGRATFGSPVVGVTQDGSGVLTVTGANGSVTANRVVLAMPRRALEIIAPGSVVLDRPEVRSMLNAITGRKVMKIFLTYPHAWWNGLGITAGASSTDLPLSQTWYFDPPQGSDSALLMASYNDTLKTTYWQGLESGERFGATSPGEDPFWTQQAASIGMVDEVQRQLAEFHQMSVPDPSSAAYKDWSGDPFGGAYYTWNVGVDVAGIAEQMLQPDPGVALNVCGSAYSHDQGWAEGALRTAERVVTSKIGLDPTAWSSF